MRTAALLAILIACGDDDGPTRPRDAAVDSFIPDVADAPVDAPVNGGFVNPTAVLAAWSEPAPDTFMAETLDLSCLGTSRNDPPTTIAVSLAITVRDFQTNNLLPSALVTAFAGTNSATTLASGTTDASGNVTLTIPTNTARLGFRIAHMNALPTLTYDRLLAPATASQTLALQSMSNATAATLPALIGETRTPGTALVVPVVRDCQGHTLSNFVATVSTTAMTVTHAMNAETYYFSDTVGLPVRHTQAPVSTRDGRYMVIDVPPLATGYLQAWGFRDTNELTTNTLTRIAELAVPVTADTAILVDQQPRATN